MRGRGKGVFTDLEIYRLKKIVQKLKQQLYNDVSTLRNRNGTREGRGLLPVGGAKVIGSNRCLFILWFCKTKPLNAI